MHLQKKTIPLNRILYPPLKNYSKKRLSPAQKILLQDFLKTVAD
jgi:hypothetical protein